MKEWPTLWPAHYATQNNIQLETCTSLFTGIPHFSFSRWGNPGELKLEKVKLQGDYCEENTDHLTWGGSHWASTAANTEAPLVTLLEAEGRPARTVLPSLAGSPICVCFISKTLIRFSWWRNKKTPLCLARGSRKQTSRNMLRAFSL